MKTFRVYIEQINATYVDVKAANSGEAREKAGRKWRKEDAHPHVTYVEECPQT